MGFVGRPAAHQIGVGGLAMTGLTICSKSPWLPNIRREHAFAQVAQGVGVEVVFVESPSDIRACNRLHPGPFLRAFGGESDRSSPADLEVISRSTLVPGHRNRPAEALDAALLRGVLAKHSDENAPTVVNLPWHWPAVATRKRKVFDCADDWTKLYPLSRAKRFGELFRRIADEADQVILASGDLAHLFADRTVAVIPNAANAEDIVDEVAERPHRCSLAYVGTLSERFDVETVTELLIALPQWKLDIYGPCRYAGRADRPAPELDGLLNHFADRVVWHGTIPRASVAGAIDGADVLIVPTRPDMAEGQSSMKLFDIAARGRPAVVSRGVSTLDGEVPPGTYLADGLEGWVEGVKRASIETGGLDCDRVAWARSNTWDRRWPGWASAVYGEDLNEGWQ